MFPVVGDQDTMVADGRAANQQVEILDTLPLFLKTHFFASGEIIRKRRRNDVDPPDKGSDKRQILLTIHTLPGTIQQFEDADLTQTAQASMPARTR